MQIFLPLSKGTNPFISNWVNPNGRKGRAVRRIESSAPRQNKRAKMNERAMIKIINQKKKSVFRKKLLARKQAYALMTRMLNNLERNLIARKELYSESYSKFSLEICPPKRNILLTRFLSISKGRGCELY